MALRSGAKMMVLVSGFIAFTVLAGSMSASAASLCRSALLTPPTQEQINITLDGLARLTLEVDLAKSKSTESKTHIEADLAQKQNEVMQVLNLDRSGLREQLRPRIRELQKEIKSSTKKTARHRQLQEKVLAKMAFKEAHRISFPLPSIDKVLTAKLPEITLTIRNQSQVLLYTYDVNKKTGDYTSGWLLAANTNASKKNIYGINEQLEIIKFLPGVLNSGTPPIKIKDANNGKWESIEQASLWKLRDRALLEVSPGEKYLALHVGSAEGELYIIRITDGEVVHHQVTGYDSSVKFRTDDEFYVFDPTAITRHNLSTQDKVKIENLAPEASTTGLWLDPQRKNLIHANPAKMTILDPITLEVRSTLNMPKKTHLQIPVPNSDRYFLAFIEKSPQLLDYSKDDISLFTFDDQVSLHPSYVEIAFTDDGNSVLFFSDTYQTPKLSIWTREE